MSCPRTRFRLATAAAHRVAALLLGLTACGAPEDPAPPGASAPALVSSNQEATMEPAAPLGMQECEEPPLTCGTAPICVLWKCTGTARVRRQDGTFNESEETKSVGGTDVVQPPYLVPIESKYCPNSPGAQTIVTRNCQGRATTHGNFRSDCDLITNFRCTIEQTWPRACRTD